MVAGLCAGQALQVINTQPGLGTVVFKPEPGEVGWACEWGRNRRNERQSFLSFP